MRRESDDLKAMTAKASGPLCSLFSSMSMDSRNFRGFFTCKVGVAALFRGRLALFDIILNLF